MRLTLACLLALLLAAPLLAQETPPPEELPEIAPRELEIRGRLEISFPSLQRQPLSGFNPPPRLYQLPADRRPFVEEYLQRASDLPASPLLAPEPPASPLAAGPLHRARVEAGVGRHFSRVMQGWTNAPVTARLGVYADARYEGSDGHRPFEENEDLRAHFDAFSATAGLRAAGSTVAAGVEGDAFSHYYRLFGALPSSAAPVFELEPQPRRHGYGAGASAWLRTAAGARIPAEARLRYSGTRFATDVRADDEIHPLFNRAEKRLEASGATHFPASAGDVVLDGSYTAAGLDTEAAVGEDYAAYLLHGGLRFRFREDFRITLGARLLGFRTSGRNDPAAVRSAYVLPSARLDAYLRPALHLYLKNEPSVRALSLRELYEENPYAVDEPVLQPVLTTTDVEGGAAWYRGRIRVSGQAGFRYHPNLLYFEPPADPTTTYYDRGFFEARYGSARVLHAGASVSAQLPASLFATLSLRLRNGRLTADDAAIPYFPAFTGETSLSYRFLGGRALAQATGAFQGSRFTDRRETRRLPGFLELDLWGSYDITPRLAGFVRVDNVGPGRRFERWAGYPERTLVTLAGIRYLW